VNLCKIDPKTQKNSAEAELCLFNLGGIKQKLEPQGLL